ncbi:MAG TPA: phospholipid carrier-dependent glycosyltransferase [Steroidobacteraceae bacterium]|nr:phospholipid carrier-dependent glycosyltransferase [Steroidobacteraceae bacterium]
MALSEGAATGRNAQGGATDRAAAIRDRWTYLGLSALVVVLWFAMLPLRPLFNPDEGRYAEIPREMLAGGDWVIPHLNGLAYIEKPPLQYWATAAALAVFGQGEFGARFYTACCALATLGVVWLVAWMLWETAAAWRAAAVLSSMMLFVVLGQLLTLDMSLTFYMTLSLAGFLLAQAAQSGGTLVTAASKGTQAPATPDGTAAQAAPAASTVRSRQRCWMLVAWGAAALGVLTKGLVAAAIPAAVLILYSAYSRDFSPWRRLHAAAGLPLLLAIAVPWHWLAALRLPGFLQFFFVHEHFQRYLTPSADREEAWWFFAAVFALGSIPWTLPALRVVAVGWRRRMPRGQFDPVLFLWIWVVFICLFFSLSDSKLIPYILPAMPGLALLMAAAPVPAVRRDVRVTALFTLAAALAAGAASLYGPRLLAPTDRSHYFALLAKPMAEIAALLGVSGLFVLLQRRRDPTRAAVFLGAGWCLTGLMLMRAAGLVAPLYSGAMLARAVDAVPREMPIYSIGIYDQTLPFYWRHTVKLVAYRGELDFGLRRAPEAELPSVAAFVDEWRRLPDGYAVMEKSMFDDLEGEGVPMREVARDVHRVLAARR